VAAVVATPGAPGERELQDWVRRTLAGYKVPRRIVLVERLPRTPTGKLEVARARRIVERGMP
jgi:acyl-CoA synthetase (AMP-forming)/AMP-acid ligase II